MSNTTTATEHLEERGIAWNEVYDNWRNYYFSFNDEEVKNAFNSFYDLQNFFAAASPTVGTPLSLGVSVNNGQYAVIMALHICEQLLQFITQRIPQVQPPSLSNLNPSTYQFIERFEATTPNIFSKYQQKAKKNNKAQAKLVEAKRMGELAHTLVHGQKYNFISIDIEAYELDHSILLEIGWSMYDAKADKFMDQHYAINTYKHLTNGKFVDDQRMRFAFGTTVWCNLKQALKELRKDLDYAVERDGGFVLVGHGLDSDLKYLKQQRFKWPTTTHGYDTLGIEDSAKIAILNTDTIYAASINDLHNPPSLGKTLDIFNIEAWNLHNAGNDAHYTLLLLMKLVN